MYTVATRQPKTNALPRRLLAFAVFVAGSLPLLLTQYGCAANGQGWRETPDHPPLPAVFVLVDREEPGRQCKVLGAWGCAVRDYAAGVCRIYIEANAAPWQRTHELAHCAGYSHP